MRTPRPRLTLAFTMALILVIGGTLGWVTHLARVQREAVQAIKRAGGVVAYEWEWKAGIFLSNGKPPGPSWLVKALGVDYFGSVVAAGFETGASDSAMVHVGKLDRLERLYLVYAYYVTDAGLAHLKSLTRLRDLDLAGSPVTDRSLAILGKYLRDLQTLNLGETEVTDAGLKHLAGMKSLRKLELYRTRITDAGLPTLEAMPWLGEISLDDTAVSAAGVRQLARAMQGTKITWDGRSVPRH